MNMTFRDIIPQIIDAVDNTVHKLKTSVTNKPTNIVVFRTNRI